MGKLLCDSTTVAELVAFYQDWENIIDLEEQQRHHLQRLHAKGVLWKPPSEEEDSSSLSSSALKSVVLGLYDHDKVSIDRNRLFTALL
ncbi:hypothetical protein glysoja_025473 [Glycine soja]|uniref:Uncharacterized protein n=1 Tax=Glycine soja TaxID=3848 RepID=A0A0B2R4S0_GLYSO|nr:hypothetical protein glysoja_025473 [Glycine soja]